MATFGELIHGRKPEVAPFIPTDPLEMLKKLMSGEIKEWPQIAELGQLYQDETVNRISELIPNFRELLSEGAETTRQTFEQAQPLLRGELPPDVARQIMRSSAYQSLGSGLLGSPAGQSFSAFKTGMGSLEAIQKGAALAEAGQNATQRWQAIASGTMLPLANQLYSPEWFSNFMAEQNKAKRDVKQLRYNVAAAPDPAWADRAKLFASIVGMAAGGGMGGGMNPTGSYQSTFGAGGGTYGGAGAGSSWTAPPPDTNPGFLANYQSAVAGNPNPQGVGGWMGKWFSPFNAQGGGY